MELDQDTFEDMLLYAVSYCITRSSYANGDGEQYVRLYFDRVSRPMQRILFQRVRDQFEDMSAIDKANWHHTLAWMKSVLDGTDK